MTLNQILRRIGRWLPASGIASPLVLATATLLVAARRPDYSHIHHTLSELGSVGRPGAAWMNYGGIIPAGVLTSVAALSTDRALGESVLSRAGAIVQAIAGACLAGTALFPWRGAPNDLSSVSSKIHLSFALTGFFCLALCPLLVGLHARRLPALRTWFWFSILTAASVFALGFLLPRPPYLGIFQRGTLVAFFLWLIAISIQSLRVPAARAPIG
jgi:hypothetical membrane protein